MDNPNPSIVGQLVERNLQLLEAKDRIKELEKTNFSLKGVVKNLSDDLARNLTPTSNAPLLDAQQRMVVLTDKVKELAEENELGAELVNHYKRQVDQLEIHLRDKDEEIARLKQETPDKNLRVSELERKLKFEEEQHKQYEEKLKKAVEESKNCYNSLLSTAKSKIDELTKQRDAALVNCHLERDKPKLSDSGRIQEELNWLMSQRNSLSRQCSDMFKIMEKIDVLLETNRKKFESECDYTANRLFREIQAAVKNQIYSGNKYYAPDYDELMFKFQLAKTALTRIRDLNNPGIKPYPTEIQSTTEDIAKTTLVELEPNPNLLVKVVK